MLSAAFKPTEKKSGALKFGTLFQKDSNKIGLRVRSSGFLHWAIRGWWNSKEDTINFKSYNTI